MYVLRSPLKLDFIYGMWNFILIIKLQLCWKLLVMCQGPSYVPKDLKLCLLELLKRTFIVFSFSSTFDVCSTSNLYIYAKGRVQGGLMGTEPPLNQRKVL